jgi:hypothetical protein
MNSSGKTTGNVLGANNITPDAKPKANKMIGQLVETCANGPNRCNHDLYFFEAQKMFQSYLMDTIVSLSMHW